MNKCCTVLSVAALAALVGCATSTSRINTAYDTGAQVAGFDYRDVQETAHVMLQSLIGSGRLNRADGGAYVLTIGKITNDTNRRFDTDVLTSYITEELMNSGKVLVTSAMAQSADNRDEMINAARSVRGNAEFNQASVAAAGQMIAPTHSLYGKIIEQQIRMDNGDRQIEYYIQLRIVDLGTGLQWWQKQHLIGKRADARNAMY